MSSVYKENLAIERIKMAATLSEHFYKKPVLLCYSGGKDSDVLLELAKRSGVHFEIQHSHTTVDAPQTVYHIREVFRGLEMKGIPCTINMPRMTMWQLIVHKKIPPTRLMRYCCSELKEQSGRNRHIMTGVRWAESVRRKKRGIYETITSNMDKKIILSNDNDDKRMLTERCQLQAKTVTNPIIDWTDEEIIDFIHAEKIKINPLYSNGYCRVGCIGCPMAGRRIRKKEFSDYPTYQKAYIRAFAKMLEARKAAGLSNNARWTSGQAVFEWWMENPDYIDGQMEFELENAKTERTVKK